MINLVINRLIQEHRYFRMGSEDDSNSEEYSDIVFHNEVNLAQPIRPHVTKKQIIDKMLQAQVKPKLLQHLILDYFLTNDLLDEATVFAEEAGLELQTVQQFQVQRQCRRVLELLASLKVDETIAEINGISPEILGKNPILEFEIRCFKLKLMKKVAFEEVNSFVEKELLAIAGRHSSGTKLELREKLEDILGLFLMTDEVSVSLEEVSRKLLRTIHQHCGIQDDSKIEVLIGVARRMQKLLRKSADVNLGPDDLSYSVSKLFAE